MQTIYLDISNKGVVPTVYAKQGDVGRKFQVVLTDSGLPYVPVSGSVFSVWYSGASGEGNYTDIGDKSAFSVNGNKIIVEMITQMLSNGGDGILSLVLNDIIGNQIGLWSIRYVCESVPGAKSKEAKDYYTAFSESVKKLSDTDAILRNKLSVDGSNTMEANLPMGNHRVTNVAEPEEDGDAVNLAYAKKVGNPRNLLDNSDFRNPVNQRGLPSYTGAGYTIDRWYAETAAVTIAVNDGFITINKGNGYGGIYQNLEQHDLIKGKMCTLAINIDGVVYAQAFIMGQYGGGVRLGNTAITFYSIDGMSVLLRHDDNKSSNIYWAALYEGEYTAETIPDYQTKGYGVELLECMRYYQEVEILAGTDAATSQRQFYTLPIPMRIIPTYSCILFGGANPNEINVRTNRLLDVIGAPTFSHVRLCLSADL